MAFLKRHKGLFISALVSILGFFPLMGAPGFALISLFQWLISVITGAPYDVGYGDSTWPMAIMYAIVFPWVVFAAYMLVKHLSVRFGKDINGRRGVLLACLLSVLGLFAFHAVFCNPATVRAERERLLEELKQN